MTGHRGGAGSFAKDREKASEAGKKSVKIAEVISLATMKKTSETGKKGGYSHGGGCKSV
nr:hypothetical protein [Erwinia sp. 198]